MYKKRDGILKNSPEFCEALKFVIKFQISSLLQQLADSGEESVVITANVTDGTADHLGSDRGTGFLDHRDELQKQFLSYCAGASLIGKLACGTSSVDAGGILSPQLLSHTTGGLLISPNIYHKDSSPRINYDRENSTSDSVFSPNRRKSSASSRSVDDEVLLYSGHEYSDPSKNSRETSGEWNEQVGFAAGDVGDKISKYLPEQSPAFDDDAGKDISLSSPTYFQYPKVSQSLSRMTTMSTTNSIAYRTSQTMTPVTLLNPLTMYKLQMPGYSDALSMKTSATSQSDEKLAYKSPYESTDVTATHFQMTEPYCTMKTSPIVGDHEALYKIQKKADTKIYHRQGNSSRKQPKSCIERRASDSVSSFGYKTASSGQYEQIERKLSDSVLSPSYMTKTAVFSQHFAESDQKFAPVTKMEDESHRATEDSNVNVGLLLEGHLAKTEPLSEETLSQAQQNVHQSMFASTAALLSPTSRNVLSTSRMNVNRERSQSCSEVGSLSQEVYEAQMQARTRFPSSSFVENLDTPLIIDDNIKHEIESDEGLDLSQKRPKISGEDFLALKSQEGRADAAGDEQSIKEMYERMSALQNVTASGSNTDQSVKKYGKGNFIKVATGYQCRICCRVIRHMNNTTAHMRIHANIRPYKCQLCNQQFKYEVDRRYHFSKNHVDLFSKMYFPDGQKKPE